ncbi:hypothetical protein DL765_009122 [Monosporascus sp. GIB2]|nr:hypothetical protein DL765_009122 [Monosporascus sp. GIB2]
MSSQQNINLPYAQALTKGHCISLGNLHFKVDRNEIEKAVKDKAVGDCILWWPNHGVNHKGWCHIQFVDQASAEEALVALDGLKVRGRTANAAKTKRPIDSFLQVSAAQATTSQPSNSSRHARQSQTAPSSVAQAPTSQANLAGTAHETQATSSPEVAQASTDLAEKFAALDLETWPPCEWTYDPEHPHRHEEAALKYYEKLDKVLAEAGVMERPRLRTNSSGETTGFHSLQFPRPMGDEGAEHAIYMQKPSAQEGKKMEYKRIELSRVPELEAEGWTVWEYPAPATDPANKNKDPRNANRMRDVESTDAPYKDTAKLFPEALDMMKRSGSKSGSDQPPDTNIQAQASISTAPFRRPPEWSDAELNSATSGGHVQIHKRPAGVGLGWGDYDLFDEWQGHGREIKQDMVENKPWSLNSADFDFVTEGDPSDVTHVSEKLKGEEEVGFEDPPKSLWEKLNERKTKEGQPKGGSSRGGARGGPRGGGRGGGRGGSRPALTGNDFW